MFESHIFVFTGFLHAFYGFFVAAVESGHAGGEDACDEGVVAAGEFVGTLIVFCVEFGFEFFDEGGGQERVAA